MELKNNHNVYLLGAGFSNNAGLPLIADFLVRMRDSHEWLVKEGRLTEAEAVRKVLEFRLEAASAAYWVNLDLENIEELFSLASASKGGMDQQIRLAIAATMDAAYATRPCKKHQMLVRGDSKLFVRPAANNIPAKYPVWVKPAGELPTTYNNPELGPFEIGLYDYYLARLLGMFVDGSPQGENTLISFNYDTIIEDALTNLKIKYCYGFKPQTVNFNNGVVGDFDDSALRLLKLHGSVNWAQRPGNETSLTIFKNYDEVRQAGLTPELVPPTWKKVFENQLEAVWETAVQRLNTATRIIIIGFSMPPTDVHFKYLMAAGLQQNMSLRQILFVNNASGKDLEERARKLLREAYVNSKLIDFAPMPFDSFLSHHNNQLHRICRQTELGVETRITVV